MFRKYVFTTLAIIVLLVSASLLAYSQTGELRGHINIKQADGKIEPASDAVVEVYRTDLAGKYPTKANKKGQFVFAGLPYVGSYIIAVSHPSAQPTFLPNVKAGRDIDYEIVLDPGNGGTLTLDQIKASMARSGGGGSSPSGGSAVDKAKREELLKKNAEIEAKNKKAEESNVVVSRTFKAGNDAIKAKNYDEAVKQYDEGLAADPEHPGAPSLLTNKSIALRSRAVDRYNVAIQAKDDAAKAAGIEAAKKDWKDSAEAAGKAVEMLKAQSMPTDPAQASSAQQNKYFALVARAEAMRFVVTKADQSQADAGIAAYQEYIAAETDAAKKAKAQRDMAQMLFDAGALDKAQAEYRKILEANPEDVDALVNMGMILFNQGALKDGEGKQQEAKATYQEAANYLQKFVDKAPDTHALKNDARGVLEELKNQQNVEAEKVATPTRRRKT